MREKTDLSGEFGLSSDHANREFGSPRSAIESKTDLSLEWGNSTGDGAQEFTTPDKSLEFSDGSQASGKKRTSRKERHRRTLLLQMAAVGLTTVLVVNSFGGDILGSDRLFDGPNPPPTSQPEVEPGQPTPTPGPQPTPTPGPGGVQGSEGMEGAGGSEGFQGIYVNVYSQEELDALALREDADQIVLVTGVGTDVTDLSALAGLTNLASLYMDYNDVSDLTPLAGLVNLIDLDLNSNNISDVTPLEALSGLRWLLLWGNDAIPEEQVDALRAKFPDCYIEFWYSPQ